VAWTIGPRGPGVLKQSVGVPTVRRFTTTEGSSELLAEIRHLLEEAFEGDFSDEDWEHALGGWHVVVEDGDAVVSHAAVVPRILEVAARPVCTGYVEAVATAPERQREGLGSLAMTEISEVVRREFAMGALSTGDHRFYEQLGWERWQGPTFVRHGSTLIRTEEDDDGVMVLRFGPSEDVELIAALSCESRPGDDW
jgi:aminoglycoside 2'-N-acetyltransferase I